MAGTLAGLDKAEMANETVNTTLNDIQREYQDFLDDDNDEGNYRVSLFWRPFK